MNSDSKSSNSTNQTSKISSVTGKNIPSRFDANKWKTEPKKEHPMYQTSSNEIGKKSVSQFDLPIEYHGLDRKFTKKQQMNSKIQSAGLNTAMSQPARPY